MVLSLPANPHQKAPDQGQNLQAQQDSNQYVVGRGECDPIVKQHHACYLHTPGHKVEGVFVGDGAMLIAYSKAK